MFSNSKQMIQQIRQDFERLIEYVSGEGSQTRTAYEVELTLFRQLLALGRQLLLLFFQHRAAQRPKEPVHAPDGTPLPYHSMRPTSYYSVFGKVQFQRRYYYAPGHGGICPLDAKLSLPARCYSDLLREWTQYCITDESYAESIHMLKRILGLSISKQALETSIQEDAIDVDSFYDQKPVPPPETEGLILVLQADGKGVPMVRDEPACPPACRGKGQKRTKKKEAIVTAIYTINPYHRTPEQVVKALMAAEDGAVSSRPQRPVPKAKEVRATLQGKDTALDRLALRVAQRDGDHIQHRVALTDGAEALQKRVREKFHNFELVLDIIHATEHLWDAANALLGETHPERNSWVREQLLKILSGRTSEVIEVLQKRAYEQSLSTAQRRTLQATVGYYQRNLPYMRYDEYLSRGWPIGTGVVEGACGHLVKDRFERSGMRWTKSGAQSLLDLRAVHINDDWDGYHDFRRRCQHQRLYGFRETVSPRAEAIVFGMAA